MDVKKHGLNSYKVAKALRVESLGKRTKSQL